MSIKDVLLPLVGDPSEAAIAAIDKCVAVSGDFGARVTAVAIEEDIQVRPVVAITLDLDNSSAVDAVRSVTDAAGLLKAFDSAAIRIGIRQQQKLVRRPRGEVADYIARCARPTDLSLVPVKSHHDGSEAIVERLLFHSGRPVLMCPQDIAVELPALLDHVMIAWDNSAPAARAVGDALPVLQAAAIVRVVTATDEVTEQDMQSGAALVSHLAEHGVKAVFETVGIGGSSIGKVFGAYVKAHGIDLLVMGAYRHSRLNEMVWGGATKTVIAEPPCWVMMSR
jgi:nucleotide-binding universal stress UspA family protein